MACCGQAEGPWVTGFRVAVTNAGTTCTFVVARRMCDRAWCVRASCGGSEDRSQEHLTTKGAGGEALGGFITAATVDWPIVCPPEEVPNGSVEAAGQEMGRCARTRVH